VTFNNTYELYNSLVTELDAVPQTLDDAQGAARRTDRLLIGVMRDVASEPHHVRLMGDGRPAEARRTAAERREAIRKALSVA
jgi:hypothetical protein